MVTDALRRRLYDAAARTWGAAEADALMELLPPVGWGDLARQSDVREARSDLRRELAELRTELKGEMADLKADISDLRAEVRTQLPRLVAANIASMLGVAALVAAIVKIG